MPKQHRKDLVRSRRRTQDDGDDEGSIITEAIDDSQSEASLPTDAEDNADADDSDLSDSEVQEDSKNAIRHVKSNGSADNNKSSQPPKRASSEPLSFETSKETEVMMNGLKISQDDPKPESISFDGPGSASREQNQQDKSESIAERRRREHDEYKKKRDADPAFIPTRGAFFMHDSRHSSHSAAGFRGGRGGRGRGRGLMGPPFHQPGQENPSAEPSSSQWSHDLHDTLLDSRDKSSAPANAPSGPSNHMPRVSPANLPPTRLFSTTQAIGKLQIRVLLPSMKEAITIPDVTVKRYTKLPNHRPPLRRDKPVRVSLPDRIPRYMFPSVERSFIFIPRALRPNQQGFGRGRGKGLASIGGFSSRRTSIFNGSAYSPSIMSRRSSIVRDGMASPALSAMGRPTVRLPPSAQHHHTASGTPIHSAGISSTGTPVYGQPPTGPANLPQKPAFRENWPSNLQMIHPRPQKTISVTGIEYPVSGMNFQGPPMEPPPFHHQLPPQAMVSQDAPGYAHNRQPSFSQPTGTPLSNIPEGAIHAQPFQPFQQVGYPMYPASQPYFYPGGNVPTAQYAPGPVMAPVYVQPQQPGAYMVPPGAQQTPIDPSAAAQAGMVAHEQNGMVYYIDPNNSYVAPQGYLQPTYPVPAVGTMMVPASENLYYPQVPSGTVYYPQQ